MSGTQDKCSKSSEGSTSVVRVGAIENDAPQEQGPLPHNSHKLQNKIDVQGTGISNKRQELD